MCEMTSRRRHGLHPAVLLAAVLLLSAGCATTTGSARPAESAPSASSTADPSPTTALSTTRAVYEVNGSGTALTIDYDVGTGMRESEVPLPWRKEFTPPADMELYQIVIVVAPESTNCRIILDGTVVDEQTTGRCSYDSGAS